MDQIMKERVDLLEQWIRENDNVVFFGGAGVSTESGIPGRAYLLCRNSY